MPPRQARKGRPRRQPLGTAVRPSSPLEEHDSSDDPLAMTPIKPTKKRKAVAVPEQSGSQQPIIRTTRLSTQAARPSRTAGTRTTRSTILWGVDDVLASSGDLVPPSDDDEYVEWRMARATGISNQHKMDGGGDGEERVAELPIGRTSPVSDRRIDEVTDPPESRSSSQNPSSSLPPSQHDIRTLFQDDLGSRATGSEESSSSRETSPTLPLSSLLNVQEDWESVEDGVPMDALYGDDEMQQPLGSSPEVEKSDHTNRFSPSMSATESPASNLGTINILSDFGSSPIRALDHPRGLDGWIQEPVSSITIGDDGFHIAHTTHMDIEAGIDSHNEKEEVNLDTSSSPIRDEPTPESPGRNSVTFPAILTSPSILLQAPVPAALSSPPIPDVPLPPPPAVDPALDQFRTARTFRTRTALQLQPYTKEKQKYTAALRRGGLIQVKKTVIPVAEVSSADEDDEEAELRASGKTSEVEVEDESPDRIVIGNTPPIRKRRAVTPKPVTDIDVDEYVDQYGQAPDETDAGDQRRLQKIVRSRLREEKAVRRKRREAEKQARAFERLMRGSPDELAGSMEEDDAPLKQSTTTRLTIPRQPGQPKSYSKKQRKEKAPNINPEDSDPLPDLPPPLSLAWKYPQINDQENLRADGLTDDESLPDLPSRAVPRMSSNGELSTLGSLPQSSEAIYAADNDPGIHGEGSFFINDLPAQRKVRALSSSQDSTSSSEGAATHDPRQRIARRMMPAAMLKRLEREAAAKDAIRMEKKRRMENKGVDSPMKPGRAVVRKGRTEVDINNVVNLIADADESDDDSVITSSNLRSSGLHRHAPIIVSDGSDADSIEAMEDNRAELRLQRLQQGDFESIVTGRKEAITSRRKIANNGLGPRRQPRQSRRPTLNLVKRVRNSYSPAAQGMRQTRLDFPVQEKSSFQRSNKKRKIGQRPKRPAIRLDDEVIFTNAEFEFDSDNEIPPKTPRRSKVFAQKNGSRVPDDLDVGVGKARSWAYFDRFPIDFDITPLPSGLYCSPDSYVGSGQLKQLVSFLEDPARPFENFETCTDFGVELRQDMGVDAVTAILPIITEGIYQRLISHINDQRGGMPDFTIMDSLGQLILTANYAFGNATFVDDIRNSLVNLIERLDSISLSSGKQGRLAYEAVLAMHWSILTIMIRLLVVVDDSTFSAAVVAQATNLIILLLRYGFDNTIKPIKAILRGEAETGEINDFSVQLWISIINCLTAWDRRQHRQTNTFSEVFEAGLDRVYQRDQVGPMAAERIWFLIFGLCALYQFGADGTTGVNFSSIPRWNLVHRAVSLIKVSHSQEAEENAQLDQLQGRDRYIKVMVARCVRLSATWKWHFNRESFSVATKDLGVIFKERQHRNLPTERPVDFPDFITHFDISLTAAEDTKEESAFELYLRLACVAASDLISSAQSLQEAQQAEKDVQRLIMSIFPFSPVNFTRILPPSPRQLGALYNRYSTMIVACYFSPSLLTWVLANSRKWIAFDQADFESRQICIRGLMYLAVACRHHQQPLDAVVGRLADILKILQTELETVGASAQAQRPNSIEIERTMVLVVTCFRQIIQHHSYDLIEQEKPVYPDPCLLHESWTARIFDLDLAKDQKSGLQIVMTIQAFLDARSTSLPRKAQRAREARIMESQDDYPSLGFDFDDIDLEQLGGVVQVKQDPTEKQDADFANIITTVICPKIYRLLSDMLPAVTEDVKAVDDQTERQIFISKLTKCWSDCAGVVVVEHRLSEWEPYIGAFGQQSWSRLGNDRGRIQVGLHFMLNVAKIDPGSYKSYPTEFIALLFQTIVTDRITVEHKYLSAVLSMPGALDHPLFESVSSIEGVVGQELDRAGFPNVRQAILQTIFTNIPNLLTSKWTPKDLKPFIYRCINLLVSSLISNEAAIDSNKVLVKETYHAFADTTVRDLRRLAGEYITPLSVPGLKHFEA